MWCLCPWLKSRVGSGRQSGQKPQTITLTGSYEILVKVKPFQSFSLVAQEMLVFHPWLKGLKWLHGTLWHVFVTLYTEGFIHGWLTDLFSLCLLCCRTKPVKETARGSSEESTDTTATSPTSWLTSPPEMETELEEPDDMPGLGDEELPHMLLPDSLSQLEEFGRHKRPHKAHRGGHGRPRLFSDLWVRIGDRWGIW